MYDWPEIRCETDRLWMAIRSALEEFGLDAPEALQRCDQVEKPWESPSLLLGQTCGLPYRTRLFDRVTLVGTPAYDLPDCAPGDYRSVVIVGKHIDATTVEDLRGRRAVYNAEDSQSGYSALRHFIAPHSRDGLFFAEAVRSGAHRQSVRLVAAGSADLAAIDAVSWELARRHEPAARNCRVLAHTRPTPGLPIITAPANSADMIASAFSTAVARLDKHARHALLLHGFRKRKPAEYDVVTEMIREAEAAGYPRLR